MSGEYGLGHTSLPGQYLDLLVRDARDKSRKRVGMTDQQTGTFYPETDTQDAPMPSADQQTSDYGEDTSYAARESEVSETPEEPELPQGTKERTAQQFEKLKKQVAEEREKRMRLERMFNPNVNDPNAKIAQLENKISLLTKTEEQKQEAEAYAAYPELNPKNKGKGYSERLHEHLISYMATEFAKGNNPTIKEAADSLMELTKTAASKAEREGAKKALEQLSPKEQAALEATGRSDRRLPSQDLDQLRQVTRAGGRTGMEAAMARLSKISSVGK